MLTQQLWRRLFYKDYARRPSTEPRPLPSLHALLEMAARLPTGHGEQERALARLPARYRRTAGSSWSHDLALKKASSVPGVDWRAIYRVSQNWFTGRCSVAELGQSSEHLALSSATANHSSSKPAMGAAHARETQSYPDHELADPQPSTPATLVEATPDLVFVARRDAMPPPEAGSDDAVLGAVPPVLVYLADHDAAPAMRAPIGTVRPRALAANVLARTAAKEATRLHITALRVEQTDASQRDAWSARLAVCYTHGLTAVVHVRVDVQRAVSVVAEHVLEAPAEEERVVLAAFHSGVLVTCTRAFLLCVWTVPAAGRPALLRSMRSRSAQWPACVRLRPMHKTDVPTFQLVVAYASRTISSWSVALQEFVLRLLDAAPGDASRPSLDVSSRCASAMPRAFQAATPLDLPHAPRSGRVRPYVTSIMYDDPYVVLGTQDNVLHVFQVEGTAADQSAVPAGRAASSTRRGLPLRLVHACLLYDHTGRVCSVALGDGRCVSGGADGSVMVWEVQGSTKLSGRVGAEAFSHLATLRGPVAEPGWPSPRPRPSTPTVRMLRVEAQDAMAQAAPVPAPPSPPAPQSVASALRVVPLGAPLATAFPFVSAAFDKIVCVTRAANGVSSVCRSEAERSEPSASEQVQVWSFAW